MMYLLLYEIIDFHPIRIIIITKIFKILRQTYTSYLCELIFLTLANIKFEKPEVYF
jgi:hypothetical protein